MIMPHKVSGGGGKIEFMPTPKFGPNGASEDGSKEEKAWPSVWQETSRGGRHFMLQIGRG